MTSLEKSRNVNYSLEKINNFILSHFENSDEFETKDLEIKTLEDFVMFNLAFVYGGCNGTCYKVEQDAKHVTLYGTWEMCNLIFKKE